MSFDILLEFTALDGSKQAVACSPDSPDTLEILTEEQLNQVVEEQNKQGVQYIHLMDPHPTVN